MRLKSTDIMHQPELALHLSPRSFFTYGINLLILTVFLCASMAYSQDLEDCQRDYSLLQERIRTHWNDLRHGTTLFLSEDYLQTIIQGKYEYERSLLVYYEYVRPATRQELRQGKVEEFKREAVGKDGNIYVAKQANGGSHFFQPNIAFEGQYYGLEGDSLILLPVGLDPIEVETLADQPLILKERTAQYLLFDVKGDPIVFYLGNPSVSFVFEDQDGRDDLDNKRWLAKALIGKTFLIRRQSDLRFRSSPNGHDQFLDLAEDELTITVANTLVDRDRILLITTQRNSKYFVLDEASDFLMFDEGCVIKKRERFLRARLAETEDVETNNRLDQLIQDTLASTDWRLDPWAREAISQRFMINRNDTRSTREYTYVLGQNQRVDESYISAKVNERGQFWLTSQYSSDNGLYHTRVIVYIGEDSLFSSRISALDRRNQREYEQGRVIERLRLNEEKDQKIIQTIALSQEEEIRIRFTSGGSFYDDIYLSENDRQAIRDVWMMSQMILQKEVMSLRE